MRLFHSGPKSGQSAAGATTERPPGRSAGGEHGMGNPELGILVRCCGRASGIRKIQRGEWRRMQVRSAVGVLGARLGTELTQEKTQYPREWGHSPSFPDLPPTPLGPGGPQSIFYSYGGGELRIVFPKAINISLALMRGAKGKGSPQRSEGLDEGAVECEVLRGRAPRGQQPRMSLSPQPGTPAAAPRSQRTHRSDCE